MKDGDDVIYDYEYESDDTDSEEDNMVDGEDSDNKRLSSLRRSVHRAGSTTSDRRGSNT